MPYKGSKRASARKNKIVKLVQKEKNKKAAKVSEKHSEKLKNENPTAKFPEVKEKNKGKFTRWVKRNMKGSSTCDAADTVMAAKKGKYSDDVREMANYAKNFGCKTEGKGKGTTAMKEGPTATDVTGDNKYTKHDFLVNIGVLDKEGNKVKKDQKTKK